MAQLVGHVVAITRYPVKSMGGEACDRAEIDWQGIEGDRQWAWVKAGDLTRFPWFTGRDLSELVRWRARYDDPARPRTSGVTVSDSDGASWAIGDPALAAALAARARRTVTPLQLGRGCHDAMPLSVASTASFAGLEAAHGGPLDPRRFRTNIVVESGAREGDWPGRRVRFGAEDLGSAALLLADAAPRCAMITIDPDTAERDPRVLRTVAQSFGAAFSTYASVAAPGVARVGDPVWVD